jgi:hypothetical protein
MIARPYGRSILEDLRLAEEAGMVFPEAVVEAEVDELEALNTRELRERGKALLGCGTCGRRSHGRGVADRVQSCTRSGKAGSGCSSSSSSRSAHLGGECCCGWS